MFGQTYYYGLIRKYVALIGILVDDIYIDKTDANGNITATIKVPVTYAPKDKMLARVNQDPNIDRQAATPLPMPFISFEIGQMIYDKDRKLNTIHRVANQTTDPTKVKYQYNFVPYNISFRMYIFAKNAEDGTKVLEAILPYFNPDWTTRCILIPDMSEIKEIPVVLNKVSYEDTYDGDFTKRRAIICTLDLTLKGYFYGPIKTTGLIKFVNVNLYTPNVADGSLNYAVGNTAIAEKVIVFPGLTANGQPTSNASLAVPYTQVNITDNYGFVTEIISFANTA